MTLRKIKQDGAAAGPKDLEELARHWNALYIRVCTAVKDVSTSQAAADLKKFLGGFRTWVNQFKKRVGGTKKTKKDSSQDEKKKAKLSGPPAGTDTKMGEEILASYAGALHKVTGPACAFVGPTKDIKGPGATLIPSGTGAARRLSLGEIARAQGLTATQWAELADALGQEEALRRVVQEPGWQVAAAILGLWQEGTTEGGELPRS